MLANTRKTIPELDQLYNDVREYRTSKPFKKLIDFITRFPNIGPYNAMLLYMQRPGSVYVAAAREWQNRFHRQPKVGSCPLLILRPFGPVSYVYDLADTEGEPFPEYMLISAARHRKKISSVYYERIVKRMVISEGIRYREEAYGSELSGQTLRDDAQITVKWGQNILTVEAPYVVVVNNKIETVEAKFAVLCHELAHIFCGHIYYPKFEWIPQRNLLDIPQQEFEAEAVAYIVCRRWGIDTDSIKYLAIMQYLNQLGELPVGISYDTIFKAAGRVESIVECANNQRKKIIIKKEPLPEQEKSARFH